MPDLARAYQGSLPLGLLTLHCILGSPLPTFATLPPPDDIPEEVLRSQMWIERQNGHVILERSPLDGQPLQIQEVVEKQERADQPSPPDPKISPEIEYLIDLLRLRYLLKRIVPF